MSAPNLVVFPTSPDASPVPAGPAAAVALAGAIDEPAILSLYSTQDQLEALAATLDLVPPEQEAELVKAISETLAAFADKRDRYCRFLAHIENQCSFAKAEAQRLTRRQEHFETILDKVETWTERALVLLGRDPSDRAKRRWRKLEGQASTLGLRNLPASVEILNEAEIPAAYKRATITMPAALWEEILDALPMEMVERIQSECRRSDEPMKTPIKHAIDGKQIVPGAQLSCDRVKLVRA